MGSMHAASFPTPSTYTVPKSESRTPTEVDQNLFDEPFMLDVNFEQIVFDDFVISMDNPNSFVRFDPPRFAWRGTDDVFSTALVN